MPSKAELSKIFAARAELGMDEEHLRDLVEQLSGQRSTRQLDRDQTRQLIDTLVRLGARPGGGRRKPSGRRAVAGVTAMISPDQRTMISDLRKQIGGDLVRDEYYSGFCGKLIKKPAPTTTSEGSKVIQALMRRRSWRPKGKG